MPPSNELPTPLQDLLAALSMSIERVKQAQWQHDMQQAEQRQIIRRITKLLPGGEEVRYGELTLRREGKKLILNGETL